MATTAPRRPEQAARAASWTLLALLTGSALAQTPPSSSAPVEAGRAGQQLDFSMTGGGSWSDNIKRAPVDEEDGLITRAGVRLQYLQSSRRIQSDVDVNTTFEHYQDDAFDDDVIGGVDASLNFGIVPERFLWVVQENFGQVSADPFAAPTPENQENINYLSTGPDFILHFGSATSLQLSGRYSDVNYELTDADNNEVSGTVTLTRETSGTSNISFVADALNVDFDTDANVPYDRYETYGRYRFENTRTDLSLDGGYTWLSSGDAESGGLLARLKMTRRVSASAALELSAGTEFSDAADVFRGGQNSTGSGGNSSNVLGSSDPFENRFVTLGYDFDRHRTAFGLRVQYRNELYESQTSLDRKLTIWSGYLARHVSPRLDARIYLDYEQQRYDGSDFESDETRAGGYLSWAMGRTLSLRLDLDHVDHSSSDPASEYTENRATFSIVWAPVKRQ